MKDMIKKRSASRKHKKTKWSDSSGKFEEYTIKKVLLELPFAFIVLLGFLTIAIFVFLFVQNLINIFS